MKIDYLHYLVSSDTGRHHVRQFAHAAGSLGHTLRVRAMNLAPDGGIAAGAPAGARSRLRQRLGRYLHDPKELLWNLRYARRERALLAPDPPEVLLVRDHVLTASCISVSRRLGLPLVLEMNSPAEEGTLYQDSYVHLPGVSGWLEGVKLRRADAVAVVSTRLRDYLAERHRVDPAKFVVAPNGADLEVFSPRAPRDPDIGWDPAEAPVVGFVGSFRKWHGVEHLGRMLKEVGAARPAARFLMVGDGPEIDVTRNLAKPLGDRVRFTGRVPHARVPALVASFQIGVLPETLFYGSPLKMIEWMAAGKAVVAPAYDPVREVLQDGVEGLLFQPGNADEMIRAVLALIDDPALRRRLGTAAAERAAASLSWEDNARKVLQGCSAALERHRRTRTS
jgi:glycosyltransferase involved in cell wall biosynthesis